MRTRRAAVGASLGVVALLGGVMTLAGPAGAVPGFEFTRIAGADRYATAAAIARSGFPTARFALLANGQNDDPRTARDEEHFPDALAGNYLAGQRSAPILLTTETRLPDVTETTLRQMDITNIVIIGGTTAVSSAQEQQLKDDGYTVQRIGGADRYKTAAAVARQPGTTYVGSVDGKRTGIVASGEAFPDALVSGPPSYAAQLPLMITNSQRLSPETRSVLQDLDIEHVLIPGGTKAVSTGVENEIKALGITVRRFDGTTRTQTAAMVAEYALAELDFTDEHVNLALGLRYPDALSGGPHSGKEAAPILLTADIDNLGDPARRYLQDHSGTLQDGHIFGGFAAVSARVEREAEEAAQGSGSSPSPTVSPTASASATPTATASPGPGLDCGTTTDTSSPAPTASASATTSTSPTATATASASASASATASPTENPTAGGGRTTRPELVSVAYVGSPQSNDGGTPGDTRDDFCSVQVRYTFDEPVIGKQPVASRFHLVGFEPATRFTGRSALVESTGRSVVVTFGRADSPTTTTVNERESVGGQQTDLVSLAVVDADAVADVSSSGNPVGDRPLGRSTIVPTFPAGITAAPDLVAVDLTSTTVTTATLSYEFDETVASVLKPTGFHVVTQASRDIACGSPTQNGTVVTVICPTTATDVLVRGYVESDSVSDAAPPDGADGNLNPLHAEPIGTTNTTEAPDLVDAQYETEAADSGDDSVLFTFDEDVFVGDPERFVVYQADTDEFTSASAVRQGNARQVRAFFEPTDEDLNPLDNETRALANAVGVSVLEGAVIEAGGLNRPNQEDERAEQNTATNSVRAGSTQGPDLTGVSVDSDDGSVTYTFDEEIEPGSVVLSDFRVVLSNGASRTCTAGSQSGFDTVTCTTFSGTPPTTGAGAVLGTADDGAVSDADGSPSPEGAEFATATDGSLPT